MWGMWGMWGVWGVWGALEWGQLVAAVSSHIIHTPHNTQFRAKMQIAPDLSQIRAHNQHPRPRSRPRPRRSLQPAGEYK